jgi:very-short-patch-repair endonuclease
MPSRTPNLALARAFRRAPPATERMLWKLLRDRRLEGLKFRRQVPLGRYIADFVCLSCKLIVEADGPWHDPVYDAERDRWLASQGLLVLRFANSMIESKPHEVFRAIREAAVERSG